MSPWAKRRTSPVPSISSHSAIYELNDYAEGMDTYTSNDKFPLVRGGINMWRLAQNARVTKVGQYDTRKGFDYLSAVTGEGIYFSTLSGGAADKSFNESTWQAAPVSIVGAAVISRVDMYLKNPSNTATGTVLVEVWSDSGGSPGTRLARTSIAASDITTSYSYIPARFANPAVVATGTYWIVATVQPSGSNSYNWETGGVSSNAKVTTDSGGSWSSTAYGFKIKVYSAFANLGGVLGIHKAYKSDGTAVILFAQGTSLYKVDPVTGFLTTIKSGLNANATNYRFKTVNDVVYYVNGYDGYRKWDFTTESQVNATNYTNLDTYKGLMVLVRADDPTRIDFSNFGLYETFTSTDFQLVPESKTGDGISSLANLNGYLLIRTHYRCFILTGSDTTLGASGFSLSGAPDTKGTYSPNTSVVDGNYNYFLSNDGVYRSNGTQPELISEHIYDDIVQLANKSQCAMAINKGRLYLWFASDGSAYNDSCYVWNLNVGKGMVESHDTNAFVNRAVSDYTDNDKLIVGSSVIGQIYYQELSTNDYTNLGGDIEFELQTHYMTFSFAAHYVIAGGPGVLKEIRYWEPRFGAKDDNYVVDCDFATDLRVNWQNVSEVDVQGVGSIWGSGQTWGNFLWGTTSETQAYLTVPGEYRRIALRYKHYATRQPVTFLGHSLEVQLRRMR